MSRLSNIKLMTIRQEHQKKSLIHIQKTATLRTRREITNVMLRLIKRTKSGLRRWKDSTHAERLALFGTLRMKFLILFIS